MCRGRCGMFPTTDRITPESVAAPLFPGESRPIGRADVYLT